MRTQLLIASQPEFFTGEDEYFVAERLPALREGRVVGERYHFVSGPWESHDAAYWAMCDHIGRRMGTDPEFS